MENINILEQKDTREGWLFIVEIKEGEESIEYEVALDRDYMQKLKGSEDKPEELIRRSFAFLLSREPKEAILRSFNIEDINTYFPDFESEIKK